MRGLGHVRMFALVLMGGKRVFIILMLIFVRVPKTAIDIFVLDAGGFVGGVFEGGEGLIFATSGWGRGVSGCIL